MTWLAKGMGNKSYFKIYDTSIKSEFAGISRHCKSYRLIATWLARGGLIGWRVSLFRKQFTYRYGRRRHWTASSGGFCWQTSCSVPSRPPTPLAVWRSISRFLPLVQRLLKWLLGYLRVGQEFLWGSSQKRFPWDDGGEWDWLRYSWRGVGLMMTVERVDHTSHRALLRMVRMPKDVHVVEINGYYYYHEQYYDNVTVASQSGSSTPSPSSARETNESQSSPPSPLFVDGACGGSDLGFPGSRTQ